MYNKTKLSVVTTTLVGICAITATFVASTYRPIGTITTPPLAQLTLL